MKDEKETSVSPEELRHPSRNLKLRSKGYGIAAGYEKKRGSNQSPPDWRRAIYGPLPHSGYYGTGLGSRPFKSGQAGFSEELDWYHSQYGELTSGFKDAK